MCTIPVRVARQDQKYQFWLRVVNITCPIPVRVARQDKKKYYAPQVIKQRFAEVGAQFIKYRRIRFLNSAEITRGDPLIIRGGDYTFSIRALTLKFIYLCLHSWLLNTHVFVA